MTIDTLRKANAIQEELEELNRVADALRSKGKIYAEAKLFLLNVTIGEKNMNWERRGDDKGRVYLEGEFQADLDVISNSIKTAVEGRIKQLKQEFEKL